MTEDDRKLVDDKLRREAVAAFDQGHHLWSGTMCLARARITELSEQVEAKDNEKDLKWSAMVDDLAMQVGDLSHALAEKDARIAELERELNEANERGDSFNRLYVRATIAAVQRDQMEEADIEHKMAYERGWAPPYISYRVMRNRALKAEADAQALIESLADPDELAACQSTLAKAQGEVERLRVVVEQCRAQFDFYAREHRSAKKIPKAETNQGFADICSAVLHSTGEPR